MIPIIPEFGSFGTRVIKTYLYNMSMQTYMPLTHSPGLIYVFFWYVSFHILSHTTYTALQAVPSHISYYKMLGESGHGFCRLLPLWHLTWEHAICTYTDAIYHTHFYMNTSLHA